MGETAENIAYTKSVFAILLHQSVSNYSGTLFIYIQFLHTRLRNVPNTVSKSERTT